MADNPEYLRIDRLATPIGETLIITDEAGYLRALDWADRECDMDRLLRLHYGSARPVPGGAPSNIKRALRNYFEGDLACLGAIEWRTAGTPFQHTVWNALTKIVAGQTVSYGALALRIGCPNSARAVGLANAFNPISVVLPCHRVVGAKGLLIGYGGGIRRKQWLLRHEGVVYKNKRSSGVAEELQ